MDTVEEDSMLDLPSEEIMDTQFLKVINAAMDTVEQQSM